MNRGLLLALVAIAILATANVYQFLQPKDIQPAQIPKQSQAPATLEKFKAWGMNVNWEGALLVIEAGRDRGIWAKYGLDPEWVYGNYSGQFEVETRELLSSGVRIGFALPSNVPVVRAKDMPVKIVAGQLGSASIPVYVKSDSPIKTVKDLDGKKFGVFDTNSIITRLASYLANKFSIKLEFVILGGIDPSTLVAALKTGRIDAFLHAQGGLLRLVDSGELRVLVDMRDVFPKPWVATVVWAADDMIQQNPNFVKRFVTATLETAKYLKENPDYAVDIYMKRSNAPKDLAEKTVSRLTYTPGGKGTGQDLLAAVANDWQVQKESGAVPKDVNVKIEDAVDVRFLP